MPTIRMAALGDSITQGFMGGAIDKTGLSYPTLIARSFGLRVPEEFRVPRFPKDGLPLNLEKLLGEIEASTGQNVSPLEWLSTLPIAVERYLDRVEDYWERGAGAGPANVGGFFHNLAVWGFTVNDACTITPRLCDDVIDREEGWIDDDALGVPSAPMYRTAKRVINPKDRPDRRGDTQLDALRKLLAQDGPLDVLILWYGANDCLGTVFDLDIRDMTQHRGGVPSHPLARRQWNLTSEAQFRLDYERLAAEVDAIIGPDTAVFVGTVPHVTIAPVARGIGSLEDKYFDYYARFFIDDDSFSHFFHSHLKRNEAILIDRRIDRFNATIQTLVSARPNWHLVDTAAALDLFAVRRQGFGDDPGQAIRRYYAEQEDHPLLQVTPLPSLLMLRTGEGGQRHLGGLTSLDGVHPTTIGYGIIAELFLKAMQAADIDGADPARLDWPFVIANDTLLRSPPKTWDDIVGAAEQFATIWDLLFRVLLGK